MRNSMKVGLLMLPLAGLPAFAQTASQGTSQTVSQPGKAMKTATVKASVVVAGIDKASRTLTLKGANGKTFDVVADADVRNFDQIKVGDSVEVEYMMSVSMDLKKPGAPSGPSDIGLVSRAEPGEQPGGVASRVVTVLATVTHVDPAAKTMTFQGPKGKFVTVDVKNPDQFNAVKKGDQVELTYMEAVAISVVPKPKK